MSTTILPPSPADALMDETAAGAYLGGAASPVSIRTLQRWRLEGGGPRFVRVGRLVRYRRSELDAWLAGRICESTSTVL